MFDNNSLILKVKNKNEVHDRNVLYFCSCVFYFNNSKYFSKDVFSR